MNDTELIELVLEAARIRDRETLVAFLDDGGRLDVEDTCGCCSWVSPNMRFIDGKYEWGDPPPPPPPKPREEWTTLDLILDSYYKQMIKNLTTPIPWSLDSGDDGSVTIFIKDVGIKDE